MLSPTDCFPESFELRIPRSEILKARILRWLYVRMRQDTILLDKLTFGADIPNVTPVIRLSVRLTTNKPFFEITCSKAVAACES